MSSSKARVTTAPPGKEKRGTSSSSQPLRSGTAETNRKTPITSKTRPLSGDSTAGNKNVPNILKPKVSSPSSSNDDHPNTPIKSTTIARRRSFDKPLPPSSLPKTRVSPNPRERILKSSSSDKLSGKASTSRKPLLDKLSKTPHGTNKEVAGKPRAAAGISTRPAVSVKKRTTTKTTKKQDSHAGSMPKAPITLSDSDQEIAEHVNVTPQAEESDKDHDHHEQITETDSELGAADSEDNNSAMEDHEELNANYVNNVESSLVVETIEAIKMEEPEEQLQVLDEIISTSNVHKELEEIKDEPDYKVVDVEESTTLKPLMDDENQHEKEDSTEMKNQEAVKAPDGDQNEGEKDEAVNMEDQKVEAVVVQEIINSPIIMVSSPRPHQNLSSKVIQGKKMESAVSNDVIEETASKLREQRKNKVKALAGAFETVISLQDPK